MTGLAAGRILRAPAAITSTSLRRETASRWALFAALLVLVSFISDAQETSAQNPSPPSLTGYRWDFGRSDDKNFDRWPDDWQRRRGTSFPNYVKIGISAHDPAHESQIQAIDTAFVMMWSKLREAIPSLGSLPPSISDLFVDRFMSVELDGGQAMVQSPPKPTSQLFQYRFSCRMMTEGLRYDTAQASLVFLDADGKEVLILDAPIVSGTTAWRRVEVDQVRPPQHATQMLVRLSVRGSEDGLQDIRGRIGIDDIQIEPFPQLQITTNEPLGVYDVGQPVVVSAKVLGMPVDASLVVFRLVDHDGVELHRYQTSVNAIAKVDAESTSSKSNAKSTTRSTASVAGPNIDSEPIVSWKMPAVSPGFYRIRSSFADDHSTSLSSETTIAIIQSLGTDDLSGPFGWALPRGDQGIESRELTKWLARLGVAWLKYPCWTAPGDTSGLEHNTSLMNRMQSAGIQTVGVLDQPPSESLAEYEISSPRDAVAANLFRDQAIWQPRLEPVMTQLTLKVRSWQLGSDRDYSFLGRPRLQELVSSIRNGLQGFGQPIEVAISWPWMEAKLPPSETSWQATSRSSGSSPLTADELNAFLDVDASRATAREPKTWLVLDPIDQNRYDRDTRIRDLVLRMAAVRRHNVQTATVSDPFDSQSGLLRQDGRPSDLLLPWRTASLLLGDVRYVGSLQLRNGAQNQVFAGENRAVMMMWSPTPSVEEIYLGEHVQQVDVWGRVTEVPTIEHAGHPAQRIETGPMPIFLIGVDATLLAFRMSVAIAEKQLDSILGQAQRLTVVYTNPTRESMVGEMRIRHPNTWQIGSPTQTWELLGGRSAKQSFDVVLGNAAMIGEYEIALDFDFQTSPPREITIYRSIKVGVDGLSVKLTTELTAENDLHVIMEMTNLSTKTLSYDCMMFPPPGRQYQRRFVLVPPSETTTRDFYFIGGRELLGGRVLLRAVEQDGRRVLNYDALVTP